MQATLRELIWELRAEGWGADNPNTLHLLYNRLKLYSSEINRNNKTNYKVFEMTKRFERPFLTNIFPATSTFANKSYYFFLKFLIII